MNEFLDQFFTFYHVSVLLFALAGLVLLGKWLFARKEGHEKHKSLSFERMNNRFEKDMYHLEKELRKHPDFSKEVIKLLKKNHKSAQKQEKLTQQQRSDDLSLKVRTQLDEGISSEEILKQHSNKIYVLEFVGNLMASRVEYLREEISFLIQVATPSDEIVVCLSSPGGAVPQYGLASSQLVRLRHAGLRLTVCVDVVAASGGYMMAAVADKIVAAPFAFIGSIGVVAGIPNFHKVLKKHDIDYYMFTAGEYKRTVTPLSEVTESGKQKFQESLTDIHTAFKSHIKEYRPQVNIEEIATGEYWLASQAKSMGLVDEIMTSDDYLMSKLKDYEVIRIETLENHNWLEKVMERGVSAWGLLWSRHHPLNTIQDSISWPQ
ncbi:MAG: protease SohB [SAR324 cluster bacterium]|nr:protease SohB [SAR324 cluster bacterium]